jgi:hypothetical protein
MFLGVGILVHAALLAGSDGGGASAASRPDAGGSVGQVAVQAVGRGWPWLNLQEGVEVAADAAQMAGGAGASLPGTAVALAAEDLDGDGIPDLVVGTAAGAGGFVTIYRGNRESIYPGNVLARQRQVTGRVADGPFLGALHVGSVPEPPELLAAGDFDGDGYADLVLAAHGRHTLYLLPGDGQGAFGARHPLALPGTETALLAGEIHRQDGAPDLVVGIAGGEGPAVLVFEGRAGALEVAPEALPMPGPVRALALGPVAGTGMMDLVVAAGQELVLVHGEDRGRALAEARPAPRITRQSLPFELTALALGHFTGGPQPDIAVLDVYGTGHLLTRTEGDPAWEPTTVFSSPGGPARSGSRGGLLLVRAKVSSLPSDDLLILEAGSRQLQILMADPAGLAARPSGAEPGAAPAADPPNGVASQPPLSVAVPLETAAAPLAVLPMRLSRDALSDLVLLQAGQGAPSVLLTEPVNVFIVSNELDSGPGSLRQAILDANASPGADAIDFDLSPTANIFPLSQLPRITEAVVIDGTTRTEGFVELNGNNRVIDALLLGGWQQRRARLANVPVRSERHSRGEPWQHR